MYAETRFAVTFYKTVCDNRGRDWEIVQRVVEVDARDETCALERAKKEFCRQKGLIDWWRHADRCEIVRPGSRASQESRGDAAV